MTRTPKVSAPTVKVGGAVSDGLGGWLPKGAKLEGVDKDTLTSLRAKGFID